MQTLAVPVQLISSVTLNPDDPIENPEQFLQTGDVQISTGGSAFTNITTLPTASDENNTDLIVQLSESEIVDDYEIIFHDPDGVWVDFTISVTLPSTDTALGNSFCSVEYTVTDGNGLQSTSTISWQMSAE